MSIGTTGAAGLANFANMVTFRSERNPAAVRADEIARAFQAEVKKDPIERIQESILKSHGLSQGEYDALPSSQKAAIQREIEEAIRRAVNGPEKVGAEPGASVSVIV
jgi:TPP-dependent pyruvate/acetoin dehydrogenase alpha subunit